MSFTHVRGAKDVGHRFAGLIWIVSQTAWSLRRLRFEKAFNALKQAINPISIRNRKMKPTPKQIVAAVLFTVVATQGLADQETHSALADAAASNLPVIVAARDPGGVIDVESALEIEVPNAGEIVDLGSITKTVTAIAVLHLVETRQLSLDANLGDLLPGVPQDKAQITLHQLLTHSSGIIESTGNDEEQLTRSEFLRRVLDAPLESVPGDVHSYSNAGYSLLAAIIEVQSGLSYEDYLIDEVIPNGSPMIGYARAYDAQRAIKSRRMLLTGFQRRAVADASWRASKPGWNLVGNGGAVTTARGFLSFWGAFIEGRIVSDRLVAEAITPHIDEGSGDTFYGYGLVVQPLADGTNMYWHDGGNSIFSADWRHFGKTGATFFAAGQGSSAFKAMAAILADIGD